MTHHPQENRSANKAGPAGGHAEHDHGLDLCGRLELASDDETICLSLRVGDLVAGIASDPDDAWREACATLKTAA